MSRLGGEKCGRIWGMATVESKTTDRKEIKVSVVVPIYGVENYLRECVDSILAQTLKEIEIILVDDGSPDKCPQIVDEYATKDPRVIAVHQKNGGYGKAVNHGFDLARGEYIGIVESDDFIEPGMYEKLYAKAKKYDADVSKGSFYDWEPKFGFKQIHSFHVRYLFDAPEEAFTLQQFPQILLPHPSIWSMIVKRKIMRDHCIKMFDERHAAYQDTPYMAAVCCAAGKIVVVKEPLYRWRGGRDGNSTSQTGEKLLYMPKMFDLAREILETNGQLAVCKEALYAHLVRVNMDFLHKIKWQYKGEYFDKFRELVLPLRDDFSFTYKYFSNENLKSLRSIWQGDLCGALKYNKHWPIIRRTLISKRLPKDFEGHWQVCILGIQIGTRFDNNLYSWAHIKIGK